MPISQENKSDKPAQDRPGNKNAAIDVVNIEPDGTISLYQKRKQIHPIANHGFFQKIRSYTVWIGTLIFLGLPWIQWNGKQAILFDLPHRQFHLFSITFWPQDVILFSWMAITAIFALFFFTTLAGRVWCGYVCPQTAWTHFFMSIEEFVEGPRNKRLKLDEMSWFTREKFFKRGLSRLLWLVAAFITGFVFIGYFSPIADLTHRLFTFQLGGWETFWIGFFTVATLLNAGWMREQLCIYACPYARFQSVMFDRDTLIVTYDEARGEPRGKGKKREGLADCIDCAKCVNVCPVGIDIRDGLQYECIACAACIDVCDDVMEQTGRPKGLVRYTTSSILEGGKPNYLRPRFIGYGIAVLVMISMLVIGLVNRVPVGLDIIRDRNSLYRENSDGTIENIYTIKLLNKSQLPHKYRLTVKAPEGMKMVGPSEMEVPGGSVRTDIVRLRFDPFYSKIRSTDVYFTLTAEDDSSISITEKARFIYLPN
jgi:cytochrome c oxidase accessory protein FixG